MVTLEIRDYDNNILATLEVADHEDFPLAITEGVSEIQNITRRSGSYTKTFRVPATRFNNLNLKYLYNINLNDENDLTGRKPIRILINGLQYQNLNYIKITEAIHIHGRVQEYDITIFGDNSAWVEDLRELLIGDIDYYVKDGSGVQQSSFILEPDVCKRSWEQFPTDMEWDVVLAPVHYGQWLKKTYVTASDLRPAIRLKSIIKKSLNTKGYKLQSNHINGNNFKNLAIPFVGRKFTNPLIADRYLEVTGGSLAGFTGVNGLIELNQVVDLDTITSDAADIWDEAFNVWKGRFNTNAKIGRMKFTFTATISSVSAAYLTSTNGLLLPGAVNVSIYIIKKTGLIETTIGTFEEVYESAIVTDTNIFPIGVQVNTVNEDIEIETDFQDMLVGDEVFVKIKFKHDEPVDAHGAQVFVSGNSPFPDIPIDASVGLSGTAKIINEVSPDLIEGMVVEVKGTLRQEKVLDVIDGASHLFNLYFKLYHSTKTLFVEPRDSFYKPNTEALDWTDKLDIGSSYSVNFIADTNRENLFKYKSDSNDAYANAYEDRYSTPLASYLLTLSKKFARGRTEYSNNFFAPTYHYLDSKITNTSAVLIAKLWNQLGFDVTYSQDFAQRVMTFYYDTYGTAKWRWKSQTNLETKWPLLAAIDHLYAKVPNLYFHNHATAGRGQFDKYYNGTFRDIEVGKMLIGKFRLKESDMYNFDVRTPIYLDRPKELHGYFKVNRVVDYMPTKSRELTAVELIKSRDKDPITVADYDFTLEDFTPTNAIKVIE